MSEIEDQRSNPYFVLGLDYGSDLRAVKAAWARRAKAARRGGGKYDLEALNQALHKIEHASEDLGASVRWFRVPANRASSMATEARGLFNPAPVPLPRRSTPLDDAQLEALTRRCSLDATRALLHAVVCEANTDPYRYDT